MSDQTTFYRLFVGTAEPDGELELTPLSDFAFYEKPSAHHRH